MRYKSLLCRAEEEPDLADIFDHELLRLDILLCKQSPGMYPAAPET